MSNNIQNKLSGYEATPPEGVWNRIVMALDEAPVSGLASRLSQYETPPPPQSWEAITKSLDRQATPVIPFYKRYAKTLKYGMAAAAVLLIVFISGLLMNRPTVTDLSTRTPERTETPARPQVQENSIPVNQDQPEEERTAFQRTQNVQNRRTVSSRRSVRTLNASAHEVSLPAHSLIPAIAERNLSFAFTQPDKYMVYSREDGNAVKLPKKLFDMVACQARDAECKLNLKKVQEKFAASAFSADFTGVLSILDNLGENQ